MPINISPIEIHVIKSLPLIIKGKINPNKIINIPIPRRIKPLM